jgi:hypothetical protein
MAACFDPGPAAEPFRKPCETYSDAAAYPAAAAGNGAGGDPPLNLEQLRRRFCARFPQTGPIYA